MFYLSGLTLVCLLPGKGDRSHSRESDQTRPRQLLYETKVDRSCSFNGRHIEIRQILPHVDSGEFVRLDIDDRDIISRSKYSREDVIRILGEYLTFQHDTSTSNKAYQYKPGGHMECPEGIKGFTVEIEALYSFTRMLTIGLPPIRPVLLDRATRKPVNTDARVVRKVFDIYSRWYRENLKTDFKNLTLPLTGSPYCWMGEERGMERYLKKAL